MSPLIQRTSCNAGSLREGKEAIERAREMIRDLLGLVSGPKEPLASGFKAMAAQLTEVQALLGPPSEEEVREISRKLGIET